MWNHWERSLIFFSFFFSLLSFLRGEASSTKTTNLSIIKNMNESMHQCSKQYVLSQQEHYFCVVNQ